MKSLNIYRNKFKDFGVSHKSLQWKSKGAAHQRFRQFWAEIDFDNKNVLDVGCGFGELGNFLAKRYKNVTYKGVDIMPEFIENGKKIYPSLDLETADYFNHPKGERYNTIICSGALNSNFGTEKENRLFRENAIKTMFLHTTNVLAFNMSGGHPPLKNSKENNIYYSDSLEILKYCMILSRRVILRQNYHPTDFTIFMYKVKSSII
ncbi:MAG: class I SAM-dependent methyltransferase [Candidatus Woesebacteria bacterium]|nr:class I SAM-dependent methyltransferase [Candidatus Woesebacteria bacterium]